MSPDDEEARRIERAAQRVGLALAKRHMSVMDAAIHAAAEFSGNDPRSRTGAIAAYSAYLGHVVAHVAVVTGISQHQVVQEIAAAILEQSTEGMRAN